MKVFVMCVISISNFNPQCFIYTYVYTYRHFPGGSAGKESACSTGDLGLISVLGRSPGERNGNPLPVFLPGEFHEHRSLVGYSHGVAEKQT